jgi:hypothetical protein
MARVHNPESKVDHNKNLNSQINHKFYPPTTNKAGISGIYSGLSPIYRNINEEEEAKKIMNPHGDHRY